MLSIFVYHLAENKIVLLELPFTDRACRKSQLAFSMHLKVTVYLSLVHSTVLIDNFTWTYWFFAVPDTI